MVSSTFGDRKPCAQESTPRTGHLTEGRLCPEEEAREASWGACRKPGLCIAAHLQRWPDATPLPTFVNVVSAAEEALPCSVAQLCLTVCDPMDCSPPRLLCPWDSLDKNPGVGCRAFLQGIFLTQESNSCLLCLLHCRQIEMAFHILKQVTLRKVF